MTFMAVFQKENKYAQASCAPKLDYPDLQQKNWWKLQPSQT